MANGLNWLNKHVPGLGFITFLMISVIWVTVMITNFTHRLSETERKCDDISTRQLPEIRAEMDRRFSKVDERLQKIELQLNRVVIYIETKEGVKLQSP